MSDDEFDLGPIPPRHEFTPEQIAKLRADVQAGAGHDCYEWRMDARCQLCDRPLPMCGRCYNEQPTFPANCAEKPELLKNAPLGMYHCPDCGAMVIAGLPHPELCQECLERRHPGFDGPAAKTFWMSFADTDKPPGTQFLGVCVIAVTAAEAAAELAELKTKYPNHGPGAEWMAAATRKAWAAGCNPGGEIGFQELPPDWPGFTLGCPRDRLLSERDLVALGLVDKKRDG